jgi:hypothetical protein
MKTFRLLILLASIAGLLLPPTATFAATVDEVISRARAHLGRDAALDGVRTLRYIGTIQAGDEARGTIEILFKKPFQQRITQTIGELREITALDDMEGWVRIEEVANPDNWQMRLLDVPQIRRLRANNWENLNFFRGLERRGGRVEHRGEGTLNGTRTVKLAFVHNPEIVFIRHFDAATGKLLLTEIEQGGTIREEGEIVVSGIRFPRRVISTIEDRTVTITFSEVKVNEDVPDSVFAVPPLHSP